ncbi:cadmium-translocating P-type ATPase [Myxococcota bacterium]|nr:cadmium-translocating P-type ATPase [Myxococcota bacterium]
MSASALAQDDGETVTSGAVRPCTWCGTEVEADAAADEVFCCSGCESAARIVQGAGLDSYFQRRDAHPPRPDGLPTSGWDRIPRVALADGLVEATLHVDGLRCAACTWVTERVMLDAPGVVEAHVSYGTGAARVRWDPRQGDLAEALTRVRRLGYRPRAVQDAQVDDKDMLLRLGVAAFATGNVMMIAAAVYLGWFSGMGEGYTRLFQWISLVLATPVALYSAAPFYRGAWEGLKVRVLHMDLPIALAVGGVYAHGLYATLRGMDGWLDSMTMLVMLLLVGRVLEQRGRRRAAEAAQALAAEAPATARRVTPTGVEEVAASELRPGDRVEVGAGEEVATDGHVLSGQGRLQVGLLTGESEPVPVAPGRPVVAGAVLVEGHLLVEVDAPASDSLLARMADMLRDAASRPPQPSAADRLAPWFVGLTLVVGLASLVGWSLLGDVGHAIEITVAVLVVACPCALALSTPLSAHAGLGAAARRGLLLRGGDAVRRAALVDLVALDKTGTLTWGRPRVVVADDAVLRIAAGIERGSVHPIARAIVDEAQARGIPLPLGAAIVEVPGQGIQGEVDGRVHAVRGAGAAGVVEVVEHPGQPGERVVGRIHLRDRIRDDVRLAVGGLRRAGIRVALVTGDHPDVAAEIARQAGIDEVLAALSPTDKASWIAARRAEGHRVMFVGDGVNDGPALAEADVGVAMGHGAASSVLVADGILVGGQIPALRAGLVAARAAARVSRVSMYRSVAYNVLAVGFAVAGLVNPLVAAVLMPLSSALVISGALSVERKVRRELAP